MCVDPHVQGVGFEVQPLRPETPTEGQILCPHCHRLETQPSTHSKHYPTLRYAMTRLSYPTGRTNTGQGTQRAAEGDEALRVCVRRTSQPRALLASLIILDGRLAVNARGSAMGVHSPRHGPWDSSVQVALFVGRPPSLVCDEKIES